LVRDTDNSLLFNHSSQRAVVKFKGDEAPRLQGSWLKSRRLLWFSNNPLKFMFATLFLAPELFHLHRETNLPRWAARIGDFFKLVSRLQQDRNSAALGTGFNHVRIPPKS